MKKLLLSTAICALCFAAPAWAQQDDQNRHEHAQGGQQHNSGQGQGIQGQGMQGPKPGNGMQGQGMQGQGMQGPKQSSGMQGQGMQGQGMQGQGMQGQGMQGQGMKGQGMQGGMHGSNMQMGSGQRPSGWQGYEHNRRAQGQHVDVHQYQRNFTSTRRYHIGSYHPPHGYYVHRWTYGETLPPAFWIQQYWIDSFWLYDLMAPPPGLVWVRVGDDAILVDEDTGAIVEVDYDVFY